MSEVDTYLTRSSSPSPKSWQPSTLTQPLATNSMKHIKNTKTIIARYDVQNHVTSLFASTVIRNPGQTVQQGTTSHQPTHAELLNLANPRHTQNRNCLPRISAALSQVPHLIERKNETANMSHESVWYSRPRKYGKASIGWYVCDEI